LSAEPPAPAALAAASEAPPTARACVVVLGGRKFAVDVTDAREVVVLDTTTPVPGAPTVVIGVMNLRGNVLPVVEARPLLGLPVRATTDRALVLADGERRAAVLIEAVLGLTTLDSVRPPAPETPGSFTVGEVSADTGGQATLLDGRAVLAALRRAWEPASGGA
jgi:purine-binding chemotaxis protein CheW